MERGTHFHASVSFCEQDSAFFFRVSERGCVGGNTHVHLFSRGMRRFNPPQTTDEGLHLRLERPGVWLPLYFRWSTHPPPRFSLARSSISWSGCVFFGLEGLCACGTEYKKRRTHLGCREKIEGRLPGGFGVCGLCGSEVEEGVQRGPKCKMRNVQEAAGGHRLTGEVLMQVPHHVICIHEVSSCPSWLHTFSFRFLRANCV